MENRLQISKINKFNSKLDEQIEKLMKNQMIGVVGHDDRKKLYNLYKQEIFMTYQEEELMKFKNKETLQSKEELKNTDVVEQKPTIDEFLCPICTSEYDLKLKKPMSLQCGHTLCLECVTKIYKNKVVECPFDKKKFKYQSIDNIGVNFLIQSFVTAYEEQKPEDMMPKFCRIHKDERQNFFCVQDKLLLCQKCLISDHLNHKIEPCQKYIDGQQVFELANQSIQILEEKQVKVKESMEKLEEYHQTVANQVDKQLKSLIMILKDLQVNFSIKNEKSMEVCKEKIKAAEQDISNKITTCQNLIESVIENGNNRPLSDDANRFNASKDQLRLAQDIKEQIVKESDENKLTTNIALYIRCTSDFFEQVKLIVDNKQNRD